MANYDHVIKKLNDFFRASFSCFGQEVHLNSYQSFSIDQIVDPEKKAKGITVYQIQYGFPQSGSVTMKVEYDEGEKGFVIPESSIFAPPADKEFSIIALLPQSQEGETRISVDTGPDMGTEECTVLSEINNNPNALKMLDFAIEDLKRAEVLGECRVDVPIGSKLIPCCMSTNITKKKEQSM